MSSARPTSATDRLTGLAITLLGLAVLAFRLGWQDYWWDEEITLMFTRLGWHDLLVTYWGLDTHRPVYYALQKGWNILAGESVWAVRGLPVAISLLILAVFLRIGRAIEAGPLAVLAALILITTPMFVHQGREIRMYGLLSLGMALSVWSLMRLVAATGVPGSRAWIWPGIALAASLALAFYAQAVAVLLPVVLILWAAIAVVAGWLPGRFLALILPVAGVYVLLILPGLWPFLDHSAHTVGVNFWIPEPSLSVIYAQTTAIYPYPKWAKPVMALLILWGFWALRRQPLWNTLLICLVIGFPLLTIAVSFIKPIFFHRVIAWTSLPAALVLAAGLAPLRPALRLGGLALVLAVQTMAIRTEYPTAPEPDPFAAFAPAFAGFDSRVDTFVLGSNSFEPRLRWTHPALFEGHSLALLEGLDHRRVIDPVLHARLLLPEMAMPLDPGTGRLFVLAPVPPHEIARRSPATTEALARMASGAPRLIETIEAPGLRLDIRAAP